MKRIEYNDKELYILEFAAKEFIEQGFAGASTNAIAKEAKVAKGLIFHYFKNKETLYIALLEYAFYLMKTSIDKKMLTLSTYMDAFVIIKELIIIRAETRLEQPLLSQLLFNAFSSDMQLPKPLAKKIQQLKERFDSIFSSFLDGLFLQERLKPAIRQDDKIFYKIMVLMEAALNYEKEQLILSDKFESIDQISLSYYEEIIKKGIFITKN